MKEIRAIIKALALEAMRVLTAEYIAARKAARAAREKIR